ncbi:aldehyde dehydrogenase family protein [Candidatus Microgenomates bacterium]|nr:aldehyde dehydrogenase family protein [Candidatus Microgenomates bacterium]
MDIFSPLDNSVVGTVPQMSITEVNQAVEAAFAAQKDWQKRPVFERVEIIKKAAQLLKDYREDFIKTLSLEIGKSEKDSQAEVDRTVDLINYYAEEGARFTGEVLDSSSYPNYTKKKLAIVERVPWGVVLSITPFNYPVNEAAPKLVSALVTGNACVFKPSTQGSVIGTKLAQVFHQAGVPPEILPVITGKTSEWGDSLISHPQISAINFTGSYETGLRITQLAGVKKLVLGLSGKDAALVLADCDLDLAVAGITRGAFSQSGQRCTGIKQVIVEEKIADKFTDSLTREIEKQWQELGPLINLEAVKLTQQLVDEAQRAGAVVLTGGKSRGRYYPATALDFVNEKMQILHGELFGPVLSITRVKNYSKGVELINKGDFGLQASLWTQDINLALEIAKELEVGTVQVNGMSERSPDNFPFTGIKHSGLGLVGGAKYLLSEMTRVKSTVINLT